MPSSWHFHDSCSKLGERRICARTYIARAKKGGGGIRLVYLDRFLCAMPECWQYQSDCSIGYIINVKTSEYHVFKMHVSTSIENKSKAIVPARSCLLLTGLYKWQYPRPQVN